MVLDFLEQSSAFKGSLYFVLYKINLFRKVKMIVSLIFNILEIEKFLNDVCNDKALLFERRINTTLLQVHRNGKRYIQSSALRSIF